MLPEKIAKKKKKKAFLFKTGRVSGNTGLVIACEKQNFWTGLAVTCYYRKQIILPLAHLKDAALQSKLSSGY